MYQSKSFCNIVPLVLNQSGMDSIIGEISAHGRTFTKNLGTYHSENSDRYDLLNFLSADGDGSYRELTKNEVNQITMLVDVCYQKSLNNPGPVDRIELLEELLETGAIYDMANISIGSMTDNSSVWLPEWIQFKDLSSGFDNSHIVWLSDEVFCREYPDLIIEVVPVIDNLNDFFLPSAQVKRMVDSVKIPQIMERLAVARNKIPCTWTNADEYQYVDPANNSNRFNVPWPCNIWTDAGNDPDVIRERLAEHILSNSTHTRAEWMVIFPDIFVRTEYILSPYWENYAAGARALDHGVYSPFADASSIQNHAALFAPDYPVEFVKATAQISGFPFRSITATSIGSIQNRSSRHKLTDMFPDFMNVGTVGPDFDRMSIDTQLWILKLVAGFNAAETWTSATLLPAGFSRVVRGAITYISFSMYHTHFLIVAKASYKNIIP